MIRERKISNMQAPRAFTIMDKETPILYINWDNKDGKPYSKWVGPKHIKIPRSLYPENITFKSVLAFCESRQPPRTRDGIEDILKKYGIKEYLPIPMCFISRGVMYADFLWTKFDGDDISYEEIRVR